MVDTKVMYQPPREFTEVLSFFERLTQLSNPRVSGAELLESGVTRLRQKPCQSGFPATV